MSTGAILLAGGRARRLDGVAKPLLEVGGRSLLARAIAAVAGSDPLTIVGAPAAGFENHAWVREERELPKAKPKTLDEMKAEMEAVFERVRTYPEEETS